MMEEMESMSHPKTMTLRVPNFTDGSFSSHPALPSTSCPWLGYCFAVSNIH